MQADHEHLEQLHGAMDDAGRPPAWPVAMDLPAVVDELQRCLTDDRQWQHARSNNWTSLVADVKRSAPAYPDSVLERAGDPAMFPSLREGRTDLPLRPDRTDLHRV
jgi:hypothetical protein